MAYTDNDLIISVSAKDADTGFRYVLPELKLPKDATADMAVAANAGLYRLIITNLQNAATKAVKDGKNVREAVDAAIASFKIASEDRSLPTVGNKRTEIAREMLAKALDERGVASTDANIDANLPGFSKARAKEIQAALDAFLAAPYAVAKRTKGDGAKDKAPGTVVEW